jgi:hypothetical protein
MSADGSAERARAIRCVGGCARCQVLYRERSELRVACGKYIQSAPRPRMAGVVGCGWWLRGKGPRRLGAVIKEKQHATGHAVINAIHYIEGAGPQGPQGPRSAFSGCGMPGHQQLARMHSTKPRSQITAIAPHRAPSELLTTPRSVTSFARAVSRTPPHPPAPPPLPCI